MTAVTSISREKFVAAHAQWWLALMLLALHAATAWGIDDYWSRAFLLAHFGLFLLWQPVWRGEREIEPRYALLVVVTGALLSAWNNWWLVAVWLAVLTGLIGGGVPGATGRRQRIVAMLAALYLLSMLLMWVVPQLAGGNDLGGTQIQPAGLAMELLVRFVLPLIPAAILFIRVEPRRAEAPLAVDLIYSLILFLLVAALVLGSFVVRQTSQSNYGVALAQTLIVIAVVLAGLSWLWNPRAGFSGLGHLMSRYVMSVGLPFERWVQELATLAERENDPPRFLAQALEHMLVLPWISGATWEMRNGDGELGARTAYFAEYTHGDIKLMIFTRTSLSPAMLLHLKLLTQMAGHFYAAKQREQLQRQSAYTQAIYETGARLTHDVKNLLQSMHSLCAAAETSTAGESAQLQALMQRQLPQIARRLTTTLDKLKAPARSEASTVAVAQWWAGLMQRYAERGVQFEFTGDVNNTTLAADLFDSVADNLIDNALRKNSVGEHVRVNVLFSAPDRALSVCDNGAAMPRAIATQLFAAPLPSQSGMGIGLYHAAKQAAQNGYTLELAHNETGRVCFALRPDHLGVS
jgi:signal transduction histidine kinase